MVRQSFDTSCAGQWFSLLGMRTSWDSTSNHSQCGWDSGVDGPCERWSGLWGGTVWVLKTHYQAMPKRNLFSHCSSCGYSQQMDLSLVQKDVVVCEALASWSPWDLPSEDVTDALRLTFWFVGLEQLRAQTTFANLARCISQDHHFLSDAAPGVKARARQMAIVQLQREDQGTLVSWLRQFAMVCFDVTICLFLVCSLWGNGPTCKVPKSNEGPWGCCQDWRWTCQTARDDENHHEGGFLLGHKQNPGSAVQALLGWQRPTCMLGFVCWEPTIRASASMAGSLYYCH